MESIKVTKGKVKQIAIKWFINLIKKKKAPIMNISGTPIMIATTIREKITVIGNSVVKFFTIT